MISIDMGRARVIAHDFRRQQRADEFAPLDEKIMKQIPGVDLAEVESDRQVVREKYAAIQDQIDSALTPEEIKAALQL